MAGDKYPLLSVGKAKQPQLCGRGRGRPRGSGRGTRRSLVELERQTEPLVTQVARGRGRGRRGRAGSSRSRRVPAVEVSDFSADEETIQMQPEATITAQMPGWCVVSSKDGFGNLIATSLARGSGLSSSSINFQAI
ncbi:hypothetical protein Ciccas_014326 [Cichlidogyrus casuarinus]|uniref:AT-hook motif nuclear-localized protein n=1 Tax=Cichlidogyrus casuarinus TaxID=1844966 RepID=A0ABD2PKK5_9PLAT